MTSLELIWQMRTSPYLDDSPSGARSRSDSFSIDWARAHSPLHLCRVPRSNLTCRGRRLRGDGPHLNLTVRREDGGRKDRGRERESSEGSDKADNYWVWVCSSSRSGLHTSLQGNCVWSAEKTLHFFPVNHQVELNSHAHFRDPRPAARGQVRRGDVTLLWPGEGLSRCRNISSEQEVITL